MASPVYNINNLRDVREGRRAGYKPARRAIAVFSQRPLVAGSNCFSNSSNSFLYARENRRHF
jgi:hypothetical protein